MYFINGQSKWRSDSIISSWYEVWEYGIKSHFLRWGRPSGNQVIIISDNNRNRDWGILFNQNPRRNRQGRNPESDNKFFILYLVNSYFRGDISYFYDMSTFWFSPVVHFVGVYIWTVSASDNHYVSRKPQRRGHATSYSMASRWSRMTNLSWCREIRRDHTV